MAISRIIKYVHPKSFDPFLFEEANEKLKKNGVTNLYTAYYGVDDNELVAYVHHDSGASVVVDSDAQDIHIAGLERQIESTKKAIEPLTGRLEKLEEVPSIS